MTNKTAAQLRILKKYGVLPIFEGPINFKNIKSPKENEKENFSNWCLRVLGRNSNEVKLYGAYTPAGQKYMENLKDDGELLKIFKEHKKIY